MWVLWVIRAAGRAKMHTVHIDQKSGGHARLYVGGGRPAEQCDIGWDVARMGCRGNKSWGRLGRDRFSLHRNDTQWSWGRTEIHTTIQIGYVMVRTNFLNGIHSSLAVL